MKRFVHPLCQKMKKEHAYTIDGVGYWHCDCYYQGDSTDRGMDACRMNILYVVNADMERPSFGNEQRTRLIYDALCKLGKVYILDVRPEGESWQGRKFLHLLPQKGWKRLVNAVWRRILIRPCGNCIVPFYPFPLRWSSEAYFPGIKFDMVIARYLNYVGLMTLWNVTPKLYVDIDDYPMQVFDTVYAPTMGRFRRVFSRLVNKYFCRFVERKLTGCWVANAEQMPMVRTKGKTILLQNIPFGTNGFQGHGLTTNREVEPSNEKYIFTIGRLSYDPNYLGIDQFLKTVWPAVHSRFPDIKYKIAGARLPKRYQDEWQTIPNVEILGFVDDLDALYSGCIAAVVPILSGGGTCIKTLEALVHSRTCVSTPFGARGIPQGILAGGANGVFVYNDSSEFVDILMRLVKDAAWRRQREAAGKAYIDANYSPQQFERAVLELLT
jgi:glycosyltransferase involved in cell wall biosynthesis